MKRVRAASGWATSPPTLVASGLQLEFPLDEGSGQTATDLINAVAFTLGSTASADAQDPTWSSQGLVFASQYAISGNVTQIPLGGDFTFYLAGVFSGTSASRNPFGIADGNAGNMYHNIQGGVDCVSLVSRGASGANVSEDLPVSPTDFTVLIMKVSGATCTLINANSGQSVSVANAAPTGSGRLGLGVNPRSTIGTGVD